MKLPPKPLDEIGFQLAPMIDMTFLLLVFFMVTTTISKEEVKLNIKLPTASNALIPTDLSNRDIISIDHMGQYWVGQDQMDKQQLKNYLKKRFENFPPLKIYVRADEKTPAGKIKELMKFAAEVGAINVIFGTYQK